MYPAPRSNCPHITIIGEYTKEDIIEKQQSVCDYCEHPGPNLWVCLHRECLCVGCDTENAHGHGFRHFQKQKEHCLLLNLTSLQVYCLLCDCEVFLENNDPPLPGMLTQPVAVARADTDSEDDTDSPGNAIKPRGLTGLQNMGNTCYMNSALQSLSNCPQLTNFFLECGSFVRPEKKPGLSKSYMMLIKEMWHKKRPSYVVPSGIAFGIKLVFPVFRGYTQQDAQEFLRCFMDQLHEELKEPSIETGISSRSPLIPMEFDGIRSDSGIPISEESSQSDYETCDSGPSSEKDSCGDESVDHSEPSQESSGNQVPTSSSEPNKRVESYLSHVDSAFSSKSDTFSSLATGDNPCINSDMVKMNYIISEGSLVSDPPLCFDRGDYTLLKEECKSSQVESQENTDDFTSLSSKNDKGGTTSSVSSSLISNQKGSNVQGTFQSKNAASQEIIHSMLSRKKKTVQYRSIISDIFDGKILSSVQCLTCDTVSFTKETFQDLSLPIPTRDHLHMIHASQCSHQKSGGTCTDVYSHRGWFSSFVNWVFSWFLGPSISLQDCLAAFFSADELKGDNMYSCEKCKKLRNGIKYSKVIELPEVLCIHLKRFRHEVMYSSKISSHVSFPLEELDMSPFLHKSYPRGVTTYDLFSVICHHGTAGAGHYTAYSLNSLNEQWYEFDDQYITAVDPEMVRHCEAYVLFYRKRGEEMIKKRNNAVELLERSKNENGLLKFYISKQWINKFNNFAEPGPITNSDFLCAHGGVSPQKADIASELCTCLPQAVWEYLHDTFGGGPPCTHLYICHVCQHEMERLNLKRKTELEEFLAMNAEFRRMENPPVVYGLNMSWFKTWENFVIRDGDPPGPIDNTAICHLKNNQTVLKRGSDYCSISKEMYQYLKKIYTGGPDVPSQLNPSVPAPPISNETSAINLPKNPVPSSSAASVQNVQVHSSSRASVSSASQPCGHTFRNPKDEEVCPPPNTEVLDLSIPNKGDIHVEKV